MRALERLLAKADAAAAGDGGDRRRRPGRALSFGAPPEEPELEHPRVTELDDHHFIKMPDGRPLQVRPDWPWERIPTRWPA